MTTVTTVEPDAVAQQRFADTRPAWTGVSTALEVTGLERTVLHAGPPFGSWGSVPTPVRNSLMLATVFEGWADDLNHAERLFDTGAVTFGPAQDQGLVVPLSGVISPSMAVHVITDLNSGRTRHTGLNEGIEHSLRVGKLDVELPEFHRWLNGDYAQWLTSRLDSPIDLLPLLALSRRRGDEGHNRTVAGSAVFADLLIDERTPRDVAKFLRGCAPFALNLWMGVAALILSAAEGVDGSGVITKAGGNGVDFGIQVAAEPGVWRTTRAEAPRGPVEPAHTGHGAVGAIGDSAVVDMLGLGGQSLSSAPAVRDALGAFLPEDALDRPGTLLPISLPTADGLRTGLSTRTVTETGRGPLVLLGMISDTGRGRIGGGVYQPPISLFAEHQPANERRTPAAGM